MRNCWPTSSHIRCSLTCWQSSLSVGAASGLVMSSSMQSSVYLVQSNRMGRRKTIAALMQSQ